MLAQPIPAATPATTAELAAQPPGGGDVAGFPVRETTELAIDQIWRHSWPWPIWLAVVLVSAAVALTVWSVWREQGVSRPKRATLIGLRVALLGLLAFMMFGWWISRHHSVPPDLVLVIDDSRSMAQRQRLRRRDVQSLCGSGG